MKRFSSLLLIAGLGLSLTAPAFAQPTSNEAANDFKGTGHELGHGNVGQGATDFGHGIKNGAIVTYHALKHGVHRVAHSVSNGTSDDHD